MDGWISQAKLLRVDIDDSKRLAAQVKKHSQEAQRLQAEAQDAASKVDLLDGEVSFNEALTENLEQVYNIQKKIDIIEGTSLEAGLKTVLLSLQDAKAQLVITHKSQNTRLTGLIEEKITALTKLAEGAITERWESCFDIDTAFSSLTIHSRSYGRLNFPTVIRCQ